MIRRRMIISRTPLRVTFVGGGTDLPAYYRDYGTGACIAAAINKYIYVNVHKRFDSSIRIGYSKTEIVDDPNKIQHPTVRESLKMLGLDGGVEITTMGDIPADGTGMGSSSCFLVGLLNALHAWKGEYATDTELAEEAVKIERDILKEPGGKQDQYIAALGGLQFMEFRKDGEVVTKPIIMSEDSREELHRHLLLFYTGIQRSSSAIHAKQATKIGERADEYGKMAYLAQKMFADLTRNRWETVGRYLQDNWALKKSLGDGISTPAIDKYYSKALAAGAEGGKLLGAGGGGFMLFFAPPERHRAIIKALPELRPEPFDFSYAGSRIIYVGD